MSEEGATADSVVEVVDELVAARRVGGAVHPPAGAARRSSTPSGVADTKLEPGAMLVVHLRQGTVTATELHRIRLSQPVPRLVHVIAVS